MKQRLFIKENFTVYCQVTCKYCGSNADLLHVSNHYGIDDTLCRDCYRLIPTASDTADTIRKDLSETFTIEEMKDFKSFEAFFSTIDAQNAWEDDWNALKQEYKGYYLGVYTDAIQLGTWDF